MHQFVTPRMASLSACLSGGVGILLALGGYLFLHSFISHRMQFEGELLLRAGESRYRAIRVAATSPAWGLALRSAPAEDLGLEPLGWEPHESTHYDALDLPFSLHLRGVEVLEEGPVHEFLDVETPSQKDAVPVTPGARVETPLGKALLGAPQPWAGLVPEQRGQPMAAVRLEPDFADSILLQSETWHMLRPELAVSLQWFAGNPVTLADIPRELASLTGAAWHVREGARKHVFTNFTPGTGLELDDGTEVLLEALHGANTQSGPLAIDVLEKNASGTTRTRVPANGERGRFKFLCPAAAGHVLVLHASTGGHALVARYTGGQVVDVTPVPEWEGVKAVEAFPWAVRLEQLLERALPVQETAGVMALPVTLAGETRALRQGALVRWDSFHLRYRRENLQARLRLVLEIHDGTVLDDAFSLGPEQQYTYGRWRFEQGTAPAKTPQAAVVRVSRSAPWWLPLAIVPACAAAGIAASWLFARIWRILLGGTPVDAPEKHSV